MLNSRPTGITVISQQMQLQQHKLDSALVQSVCTSEESGMQGEEMPWMFRSDIAVTCMLVMCFLLLALSLKNSQKYVIQRMKDLFSQKTRTSLFDVSPETNNRYVFILTLVASILIGIYLYGYFSITDMLLPMLVPKYLLLGIYTIIPLCYFVLKLGFYNLINWIFFDKKKNHSWNQTYLNLICGLCFFLFPVLLLIIYLNLNSTISLKLMLITLLFAKILLFYKGFRNFFNHLRGFIHFIMYFCTFEVVPLILFWKVIDYINNILILNF